MNIPATIRAGDTLAWTDSLADYPAPTWTLKYSLWKYGKTVITITGTSSGTDHAIAITAAASKNYAAGVWQWTAYAEKGSGATLERKTIESGLVTIKPDIASASTSADLRSHAQKVLDAIEAVLEGRASHAEMSLTVNGKAIQYLKPDELIRWRSVYRREVSKSSGKSSIVRIQFGSA